MFQSVTVATSRTSTVDALAIGYFQGEKLDTKTRAHDTNGLISAALSRNDATGALGSIVEVFGVKGCGRVLLIGLGAKADCCRSAMRTVGGMIGRKLSAINATSVEVDLAGPASQLKRDKGELAEAIGVGLGLISWNFDHLRGTATTLPTRTNLHVHCSDRVMHHGIERGLELAKSSNVTRTLSQTPPNIATPEYMAKACEEMARSVGLKCTVFKGEQLEKERFVGLINVGKASENAPCMVRLEYTPPRGSARSKPIVLVGKTMTYDSGGLSLKINNGMKGMKRDKDGGCAVIGAMHAIATTIKPRVPVVALLMCAENSISDEAYRPDDVITYRNGVTVEVTNTDAEGRLVLADGLCWACEMEDPAAIFDCATLTGGVVVALGSVHCGMWCDDDKLRTAVEEASGRSGERVWRLPHHAEYRAMMKSPIADIVNSAPVREAHPIQGAAFLSYFVDGSIPWCHLDIAGTHATDKDSGPFIPGPTGFGARLIAQAVESYRG
ncbi:MAG: leucyl aminopeptidase family protein [Phycisphaeraceae bacterium]|nr:leucyl aminopeptidase family protein [Phycisphaerales bacterium]MCB9859311.1 leucyl aminopeptidase family protein [Phycisphaeraceae bacterium]